MSWMMLIGGLLPIVMGFVLMRYRLLFIMVGMEIWNDLSIKLNPPKLELYHILVGCYILFFIYILQKTIRAIHNATRYRQHKYGGNY